MKDSILVELWKCLTPSEVHLLEKWLQSPFHNRREDTFLLFKILQDCPEPEKLSKTAIFEGVYPGVDYDNDALNYLFSFLSRQIESFIAWNEFSASESYDLHLARSLRKRGSTKVFERKIAALEKKHSESARRNASWHLTRREIKHEKLAYRPALNKEAAEDFRELSGAVNRFFLLENIRFNATALSIKSVFGSEFNMPAVAGLLEQLGQSGIDAGANDALEVVRLSYLAQQNPEDEESFLRLKNLLETREELFDPDENRDLYRTAINFALRRHNRGERPHYTQEALELYLAALEKGYLFESGGLPYPIYNNINRLACLLGRRDFALKFIEEYKHTLPERLRENTFRFNLAIYHYLGGDFAQIPALLQSFEFTDVFMHLHAREMLLKSYFELGEWPALASLCDSFYVYLRRKKDLGYHRDTYLNFIKYIKKAMRPASQQKKKAVRLAGQIRAEEYVAGRDWLLEKLRL